MAYPRYIGKTAMASGTGALTVAALTGVQPGDVILLFAESANQNIATPTGYSPVASQVGVGTAGAAGAVRIASFFKIMEDATDTTTTVADSGDHTTAIKMLFRDTALYTGNLYTTATSTQTATTSMVFPGLTTIFAESLIVLAVAQDTDAASTTTVGTVTNANLANITELHDQTVATNTGGGLAVITGQKATIGATGTSTATGSTSVTHAYHTIALSPVLSQTTTSLFNAVTGTPYYPISEAMRITAGSSGQVDVAASLTFEPLDVTGTRSYDVTTKWYYRQYGTDTWNSTSVGGSVQPTTTELGFLSQQGIIGEAQTLTGLTNGVEYEIVLFAARTSATLANTILFAGSAEVSLPVSAITGTLSATESGADTFASTGDVIVKGSLTVSETGFDTFASTGDVIVQGTLSVSETGDDTFAASGSVASGPIAGTLDAAETGSDAAAISGVVVVQGALSVSETGGDTFSAFGGATFPPIAGDLSVSETGSDTFAGTGAVLVKGSLNAAETGSDTLVAPGTVLVKGTMAATETGADAFASTGSVVVKGSMSVSEVGSDILTGAGAVLVSGAMTASETGTDSLSATGKVLISGTLTVSETGLDTFAASGKVVVSGSLAVTESGADAFAASGLVLVKGALSAVEAGADTFVGSGKVVVKGAMSVSESGSDAFTSAGRVLVKGTLTVSETGQDTLEASGVVVSAGTNIFIGGKKVSALHFRGKRISHVYRGNTLIF